MSGNRQLSIYNNRDEDIVWSAWRHAAEKSWHTLFGFRCNELKANISAVYAPYMPELELWATAA